MRFFYHPDTVLATSDLETLAVGLLKKLPLLGVEAPASVSGRLAGRHSHSYHTRCLLSASLGIAKPLRWCDGIVLWLRWCGGVAQWPIIIGSDGSSCSKRGARTVRTGRRIVIIGSNARKKSEYTTTDGILGHTRHRGGCVQVLAKSVSTGSLPANSCDPDARGEVSPDTV